MSSMGNIFSTPLGRIILGIIKIALGGFLIAIVNMFSEWSQDLNLGGVIIPVGTIIRLILAFFPLLLLFSALNDLGIKL